MDKISLIGLKFHTRIGQLPEERTFSQPLEVDVVCYLDLKRAASEDRLEETLDYRDLHALVRETVETQGHTILEALAQDVAERALALDQVQRAIVRCRKPHARLPGLLNHVEVEVDRAK